MRSLTKWHGRSHLYCLRMEGRWFAIVRVSRTVNPLAPLAILLCLGVSNPLTCFKGLAPWRWLNKILIQLRKQVDMIRPWWKSSWISQQALSEPDFLSKPTVWICRRFGPQFGLEKSYEVYPFEKTCEITFEKTCEITFEKTCEITSFFWKLQWNNFWEIFMNHFWENLWNNK